MESNVLLYLSLTYLILVSINSHLIKIVNIYGKLTYPDSATPDVLLHCWQSYTEILIDNLTWLILILSQHLIQLTG